MTTLDSGDVRAPLLIFSYGNPSRGDDGLGPALHQRLEDLLARQPGPAADLQTDFQLQIEHAMDLAGRQGVLFIDAGMATAEPFDFCRLEMNRDETITTHAMSPEAVLYVYHEVHKQPPPPAYLLTICGYEFELGKALTEKALVNLEQGYEFARRLLDMPVDEWEKASRFEGKG